jgi:hypothetical protein
LYADAGTEYVVAFTRLTFPDTVPGAVRAATLLLVADLYENREASTVATLKENPAITRLLWPHRAWPAETV